MSERFRISDAIFHSCKAYSKRDYDLAFRWAVQVVRRAAQDHYLNEHEQKYLQAVINRLDKKKK